MHLNEFEMNIKAHSKEDMNPSITLMDGTPIIGSTFDAGTNTIILLTPPELGEVKFPDDSSDDSEKSAITL